MLPVWGEENIASDEIINTIEESNYLLEKDSKLSRSVYDNILIKSPYDKFSEMTLTHNYIYIGSPIKALEELDNADPSLKIQVLKAKAFYNMEMYEESYKVLDTLPQVEEVVKLKNNINKQRGYNFATGYEFYYQKLNEEFKLDSSKIAFVNSAYYKNMQIYLDYVMHLYTSGRLSGYNNNALTNVTNEIRVGTIGRINPHFALRGDLGVKFFHDCGGMLLTNSWVKYFLNDDVIFTLGFTRNNAEQSFLSAVGLMIDDRFVGQVANNRLYAGSTIRFKNKNYVFFQGALGTKEGKNLCTNLYWDGTLGLGKIIRYDLNRPYLQKISIDAISYQSGYQRNLEKIYDSSGNLYGGYFSPVWYSDNTLNIYFSGSSKKRNFSYGLGFFGGWQFAIKPQQSFFIWGSSLYSKYRLNDHLSAELQYRNYRYANVTRYQVVFDLVVTIFKKEKPT